MRGSILEAMANDLGVPVYAVAEISAPRSTRSWQSFRELSPLLTALWRAVSPTQFEVLTLAPWSSKKRVLSSWPFEQVACNGVSPHLFCMSRSAPFSNERCMRTINLSVLLDLKPIQLEKPRCSNMIHTDIDTKMVTSSLHFVRWEKLPSWQAFHRSLSDLGITVSIWHRCSRACSYFDWQHSAIQSNHSYLSFWGQSTCTILARGLRFPSYLQSKQHAMASDHSYLTQMLTLHLPLLIALPQQHHFAWRLCALESLPCYGEGGWEMLINQGCTFKRKVLDTTKHQDLWFSKNFGNIDKQNHYHLLHG